MALTPEDIQTIKDLLSNTERKINTLATNLERKNSSINFFEESRTIQKLRSEIQTTEDNVKNALIQFEDRMIKRFNVVEGRLDSVDKRLNGVEDRLNKMDKRFDAVDERLNGIDTVLDELVESVTKDHTRIFSDHDNRIQRVEKHVGLPS